MQVDQILSMMRQRGAWGTVQAINVTNKGHIWGAFALMYSRTGLERLERVFMQGLPAGVFRIATPARSNAADALIHEVLLGGAFMALPPLIEHEQSHRTSVSSEVGGVASSNTMLDRSTKLARYAMQKAWSAGQLVSTPPIEER